MSEKKNNIFYFSPGGYGPNSRIRFWGDYLELEEEEGTEEYDDEFQEAADESVHDQDADYGCYYMNREDLEKLVIRLQKLLEE